MNIETVAGASVRKLPVSREARLARGTSSLVGSLLKTAGTARRIVPRRGASDRARAANGVLGRQQRDPRRSLDQRGGDTAIGGTARTPIASLLADRSSTRGSPRINVSASNVGLGARGGGGHPP